MGKNMHIYNIYIQLYDRILKSVQLIILLFIKYLLYYTYKRLRKIIPLRRI